MLLGYDADVYKSDSEGNLHFVATMGGKTQGIALEQAKKIAIEQLKRTAHTMSLEDQHISKEWLNKQIEDITKELLEENWKHLWNE